MVFPTHSENATSGASESPWHRWKSIRLKVKAMPLVSGRVWMHVNPSERGLTVETETTARFLGAKISTKYTRTVMDRARGMPETYVSYNAKRARRYTFGDKGYVYERLAPPDSKKKSSAPLSDWTVTQQRHFDYPTDAKGKPLPVFDYYGMLINLRHADLAEVGDEILVHVATSSGVHPYRILVAELRAAPLEYLTLPDKRRLSTVVRQMRLRILPADPESDEGFLKMKGETELWVESGSKTVLRIGGRAPKVGKITLILAEMG